MKRIALSTLALSVIVFGMLVITPVHAEAQAITDPQAADADFHIQGEYTGTVTKDGGKQEVGAQIVAKGDGTFDAVGYIGGLPGAGWDGATKFKETAKRDGDRVVIRGEHSLGVIENGTLTIKSLDGKEVGELARTERKSPTLGQEPPPNAIVLFDGSNVDQWKRGRMTDDGKLLQGTTSKPVFQDHKLHLEFQLPYQPTARGQGRGNSGLYLQGRYEVQMLDSFGLDGKDNECGGIYSIKEPDVNMCLPPLAWQTYDVDFTAARYDADGKLLAHPRMTVKHNGVMIHDNVELPHHTTAAPMKPGSEPGPIYLQDHGNPVRYRNIWVVLADQ